MSGIRMLPLIALLLATSPLKSESGLIDVVHYHGTITFEPSSEQLQGSILLTMRNASRGDLSVIALDAHADLHISSVSIGRTELQFIHDADLLSATLLSPLPAGDTLTLTIQYSGSPGNEGGATPWGGCHWGDVSYFMGVGFHAPYVSMLRHWMPSNDIPSDKATFDITFDVPANLTVAGTGILTDVRHDNDRTQYRWTETHPTATYLFTYAMSEYARIEDEWNGLPLRYYVPRQDSLKGVSHFATVPSMLEAYTQFFGPYPFDKVGYCITPIGSMEHQTMVSYAQSLFDGLDLAGSTAAHELAHMWWGDWVTCADFRDAWLNEGFATFSEALYQEHLGGRDAYLATARSHARGYRDTYANFEGVFPLYDFPRTAPSSNYPTTIYYKGSAVMSMLRDALGDSTFFPALRSYGTRHAYGNATTSGFQAVMEEFHGASLDWFFDEWVYAAGWPDYTVYRVSDASDPTFRLRVEQVQDAQYPLFRMPVNIMIVRGLSDTLWQKMWVDAERMQDIRFPGITNDEVTRYRFDPDDIVLKRIRYRTLDIAAPEAAPRDLRVRSMYPNPVAGEAAVTLHLHSNHARTLTMRIIDALGRDVMRETRADIEAGEQYLRLAVGGLSPGVYSVLLHDGRQRAAYRLSILR